MTKIVKIKGLDCAHCAKTLENEIAKLDGIDKVEINFVASSITFESKDIEKALKDIIKLTKKIEPDAVILDEECSQTHNHSSKKAEIHCCCEHHENETCSHRHKLSKKHLESKNNFGFILDLSCLFLGLIIGIISLFVTKNALFHYILLGVSVLLLGWKVYLKAFRLIVRGIVNENLLLTISVAGAIAIQKDMEAVMVIALYSIGKILEGLAVSKSRKSIEKITNFKPQFAVVIRDGEEIKLNPSEVKLGELIVIKPGECVPIDAEIIEGQTSLNTQSLTGESLPITAKKGDKILSGSIVLDGVVTAKTIALYKDSTVSKILNLIENNQQKKSKTETVISKLTKWYTLGVIVCAFITFGIVYLVTSNFQIAFYRGLIFLVVSCPCAFAISVPLSYFSGLGNASSKGILIKGTAYLDACAKIKTIVFDKTGTLTTGKFMIEKVEIIKPQMTEKQILKLSAIGEQYSIHPLATSIVSAVGGKLPKPKNVKEIAGEGVYFEFENENYFIGRKSKNLENTCVELFMGEELLGKVYLKDTIKETSKGEILELKCMGIKTVLLSGDKKKVVEKFAEDIQIDEFKSELLPQEKSLWIETEMKNNKETLAFVGDGLNDAPSLTQANVGFCMGLEGNPASVEASDIVLADDNPNKISKAIKISKFTRKIVWQNIGFSAVIKAMFLLLGAFGVTGMLSAVIADVGVTVMAILNSLRALNYNPDKK